MSMTRAAMVLISLTLLQACATIESSAVAVPDSQRVFAGNVEKVHSDATRALMSLGWQLSSTSKAEGMIKARTPATIWTMGDYVTVYVSKVTDSTSRVEVTSGSAQQFDWGKNKDNLALFFTRLGETNKQ